jgi:CRP/FNR family transcriptional regulator, cyclic AMP receptor protein
VYLCCAAMARQSHLDHLASVPLFSACSKKELRAVAKASDEITLPAGKTLCEQGAIGREAFVIVSGTAEVRRNKRKVATLGPGACVGELALLDHKPRTASVVAATDLTVLVIGTREFSGIVDEIPSIAHKLMRSLAGKVRELDLKAYG